MSPTTRLPLFPLGTVLFPGLVLPLHIFEDRYRAMVRHLMDLPDGSAREFGVVAIERGWEVGSHSGWEVDSDSGWEVGGGHGREATGDPPEGAGPGTPSLYRIGCSAQIRRITERQDGQYDLVAVGRQRFEIISLDQTSAAYPIAEVRWLDEPDGPPGEADRLAASLLELFQHYLRLIRPDREGEQVPGEPAVLSHLIAAAAALPLADRQALLAEPDTAARLRAERRLLGREVALLRQVRAVPVPLAEFAVTPSPN